MSDQLGGTAPLRLVILTARAAEVGTADQVGKRCRMRTKLIDLHTGGAESVTDITAQCREFTSETGGDGLLHVFVPHATAGVAIMELGAGSDDDLLAALRDLLPPDDRWRHRHGSPGHGRDHVMPAMVPPQTAVRCSRAGPSWGPGSPSPSLT